MNLDELYKQYGKLMVDLEIIQSKINQLKQSIANELNKPKPQDVISE